MKVKVFLLVLLLVSTIKMYSNAQVINDTIVNDSIVAIDPDEWLDSVLTEEEPIPQEITLDSLATILQADIISPDTVKSDTHYPAVAIQTDTIDSVPVNTSDSIHNIDKTLFNMYKLVNEFGPLDVDSLVFETNPFFIDMVYTGLPFDFDWRANVYSYTLNFKERPATLTSNLYKPIKTLNAEQSINQLRENTAKVLSLTAPDIFDFERSELPSADGVKMGIISKKDLEEVDFADKIKLKKSTNSRLFVPTIAYNPWTIKATAMGQFSQFAVSDNWYQGGSDNIAILGIVSGKLNYDDKKNVQWDNFGEWRMGFNSEEGDTVHAFKTNDDIFRINSKLGIKAGGNFYYSGYMDFSTQFFHNYKGVNSDVMKASFLTPVRYNAGFGLDYKYKKIFSIMVAPIAYKYIYVNDTVNVNPNIFGIERGVNVLSEIGSSLKATYSQEINKDIQIDSRFNFYTNYEKVEFDWEIVGNFMISGLFSARVMLNPRFDNTQILAEGEKAKLQFKELLSFGVTYRIY